MEAIKGAIRNGDRTLWSLLVFVLLRPQVLAGIGAALSPGVAASWGQGGHRPGARSCSADRATNWGLEIGRDSSDLVEQGRNGGILMAKQPERRTEKIQVLVTPTERQQLERATGGKVSLSDAGREAILKQLRGGTNIVERGRPRGRDEQ